MPIRLFFLLLVILPSCQQQRYFLQDAFGREVVYHGLNVSNAAKSDPLGIAWHTEADYQRMANDWGFNAVRLLFFWSHVEPQEGVIDHAYLQRMHERVDWAHRAGLKVLLDMHQDVYGPKFGHDGAPVWATRDDGIPFKPVKGPWWTDYVHPAVLAAFDHLWNDADLQDHYGLAWKAIATELLHHPAVIGCELMNEPFVGTAKPWSFESRKLAPFYEKIASDLRAVDPHAVVWVEPALGGGSGQPSLLPNISHYAQVYAPHYYHPLVHEGVDYDGNSLLLILSAELRAWEAQGHGTPWLMTEFGVDAALPHSGLYLDDLTGLFDENAAGWFCWSYDRGGGFSIVDSAGHERSTVDHLVRAYPQAVAGSIRTYRYDPDTVEFLLEFKSNATTHTLPTVLHIPPRHFGAHPSVTCSDPPGTWSYTYDATSGRLELRVDPAAPHHRVVVAR